MKGKKHMKVIGNNFDLSIFMNW